MRVKLGLMTAEVSLALAVGEEQHDGQGGVPFVYAKSVIPLYQTP